MKNFTSEKSRSIAKRLLVVAVLGLTTVSSSSCKKQEPKYSGPKETVTLGVASIVLSAPLYIAQAKGYFDEEGLQVVFKPYPTGKKAIERMFAGENEIATVAETPVLFESFLRNDFCLFGTFFYSYKDSKVIASKESGIKSPADLKGKRIGTIEKTSAHYFTYIYLTEHGIDPAAVKISFYPSGEIPAALKNGQVDAIVAFEPYAFQTKLALPEQTVTLPNSMLFRETFSLVAMKAWAGKHPESLKRMLRAVDRGITYTRENKQESIGILVKELKVNREMLEAVWDDYIYQFSLDNSLLTLLENEARWAIRYKLVDAKTIPDYFDLYFIDAMKAVKPDAVSIIK